MGGGVLLQQGSGDPSFVLHKTMARKKSHMTWLPFFEMFLAARWMGGEAGELPVSKGPAGEIGRRMADGLHLLHQ